jgi:hypothetical protein
MAANQTPQWKRPDYYGRPAAIDATGTIAAPFLAGIGIALAVLVISNEEHFGAAGMALFALILATIALVACVESAFHARLYVVTPSELEEWRPDHAEAKRVEMLEREQDIARKAFDQWADRARRAYNVGIIAFSVGVVFLLVPKGGVHRAHGWHRATLVLACVGAIAEIGSVVWTGWRSYRMRRAAKRAHS